MNVEELGSPATGAIIWQPGPLMALNNLFEINSFDTSANTWQSWKRTEHPCSRHYVRPSRRRLPWNPSWRSRQSPWRRPFLLLRQRSPAMMTSHYDTPMTMWQYHYDDGGPTQSVQVTWQCSGFSVRNLVSDWEVVVDSFEQFTLQECLVPVNHLVCVPRMVFHFTFYTNSVTIKSAKHTMPSSFCNSTQNYSNLKLRINLHVWNTSVIPNWLTPIQSISNSSVDLFLNEQT